MASNATEIANSVSVMFAKQTKKSGKEKANDIPTWAAGQRPNAGENGKGFAKRLMNGKYGTDWDTGSREYSQLKKWGDRGF